MGIQTTNKSKLKLIDLSDNTSVASSGGTDTQTLQPNSGYIYKIVNMLVVIPAIAAASGAHTLSFKSQNTTSGYNIIKLSGTDGAVMRIYQGNFYADSESPSGASEQFLLIHGGLLMASNDEPIDIIYKNSSDTNQTGTRTLEILVEEIPERC
jgi:hypothetical protein